MRLRAKDLKDKALLSGETQRGQEHGQKAGVIEGMYMPFRKSCTQVEAWIGVNVKGIVALPHIK